jgi:uncharacterized membrane protein
VKLAALVLALGGLLLAACSPQAPSSQPAPSLSSDTFTVTGAQAAEVALVVRFVDAFDGARLEEASALLTDDAAISDCDYVAHTVVLAQGREAVRAWLAQHFADHDRLTIARIFNMNPDPNSNRGVGVDFALRSSDTIARLGAPEGFVPDAEAKVGIDETGQKIRGFANGPFGADPGIALRTCTVPVRAHSPVPTSSPAAPPVGLFQSEGPVGTGPVGSKICVGLRLDDEAYRTGATEASWWQVGPTGCRTSVSGVIASPVKLVQVSLPATDALPARTGYRVELELPLVPAGTETVVFTIDTGAAAPGGGLRAYPGPGVSRSGVLLALVPALDVREPGTGPPPTPGSP